MKKYILFLFCLYFVGALSAQTTKHYPNWFANSVIYQIYPQSFQDTNGDGIGDLQGIIAQLPYIKSLGVDAMWLNPIFESSFFDAGYDVVDYYKIAPRYGTDKDLDELIKKAHQKKLKVLLDFVVGHTSTEHPWFKNSSASDTGMYADRYIWRTDTSANQPWGFIVSDFPRKGAYRKNFFPSQPSLNYGYANPNPNNSWEQAIDAPGPMATRQEMKNIIGYWMDKGVDGFRVDMASSIVKDDKDNKKTIEVWKEVKTWFAEKYPEGVLIAEWSRPALAMEAGFMSAFMMHAGIEGYPEMFFERENVVITLRREGEPYFNKAGKGNPMIFINNFLGEYKKIGDKGFIALPTANHDFQRLRSGTRQTDDEVKLALAFFFSWPAVPFLYYGEEIGMKYIDTPLPDKEGSVLPMDLAKRYANRAGTRTPMQWNNGKNAGFSEAEAANLYLPIDPNPNRPNVDQQQKDKNSMLNFTRFLINLKKKNPAFHPNAELELVYAQENKYPLVYKRKSGNNEFLVCINPKGEPVEVKIPFPNDKVLKDISVNKVVCDNSSGNELVIKMEGASFGILKIENK